MPTETGAGQAAEAAETAGKARQVRAKTVVIGLDGATWTLLDRLMAEGHLPTLARLKREGAWGSLRSVTPPMTATAWTSFMTGKSPGKHGVYDWTEPVPGTYLYRPIDSTRVQSRTIFELLSGHQLRAATVNLPLTWPARPINGIAVGDMLTPTKESPGFTWPPEFKQTLDQQIPDYRIDTHLCDREDDLLPFLDRLRHLLDRRGQLVRRLMEQEQWDLFCTVWVEMDRMQHCLWHIFDPLHPNHDAALAAKHRPAILAIYDLIDLRVQEMVERAPPGANIVFLSDHGFKHCRYKVFLNTWLAEQGFLKFHEKQPGATHTGRQRLQRVRQTLSALGLDTRRILDGAKRLGLDGVLRRNADQLSRFASDIDWSQTRAFCHGTNAIRLNLKGREPKGSVDPQEAAAVVRELKERLTAMRDPEGNPVIQKVLTREELYQGPEVAGAADVVIADHNDSVWFYYSEGEIPSRIFEPSGWASGNHTPHGLFLAWGPDVRPGPVEGAHINDISPTLLAAMGLPIPDDMDGAPLLDAFLPQRLRPRYRSAEAFTARRHESSGAETAAIEERLRGLGYLQ